MTTEEVKQIITNSKFESGLKQRLGLLLPRLGKYMVSGLGKEVSRGDASIIEDYLVSLWESFGNLLEGIKNKDWNAAESLSKLLSECRIRSNGEDELYALNLVMDVRALSEGGGTRLTSDQHQQLLDYEVWLFWHLPKDEVLFLFSNHLLYLAQKLNLLADTQAAVFSNDWDDAKDFPQIFSAALLRNKEMLGNNPTKSVSMWIQESLSYSAHNQSKLTTFQTAEFLVKDPSVQKLVDTEKKTLSEILKLFAWLLEPILDEDEILRYKDKAAADEAEQISQSAYQNYQKFELPQGLFVQSVQGTDNLNTAPTIPTPSERTVAKKVQMSEILGDKQSAVSNQQSGEAGSKNYELGIRNGEQGKGIAAPPSLKIADAALRNDRSAVGVVLPDNQKPRVNGADLADSNSTREPELPSMDSIAQDKNVVKSDFSSGGDEGNRTPRAMNGNSGSAPSHPHPEALYHNKPIPLSAVTAETLAAIIQKKKSESLIFNPPSLTPAKPSKAEQYLQHQIDKKLEDLKNKTERKPGG